jgi:hypothetical protein
LERDKRDNFGGIPRGAWNEKNIKTLGRLGGIPRGAWNEKNIWGAFHTVRGTRKIFGGLSTRCMEREK